MIKDLSAAEDEKNKAVSHYVGLGEVHLDVCLSLPASILSVHKRTLP